MGKSRRQDTSNERIDRETIQKLKAIVLSQRKEISRLSRELNRREDVSEEYKELLGEETSVEMAKEVKRPEGCPKCGHDVEEHPIGKFTLQRCSHCDWRSRKK